MLAVHTFLILPVILLVISYKSGVTQSLDAGEICQLDSGKIGTCVYIEQCAEAIRLVQAKRHPKLCGFDGKTPIICCENKQKATSRLIGLTAEQKCSEYTIASIPTTTTTRTIKPQTIHGAVGGFNAYLLQFPHMAILGYDSPNDTKWLCGGSLISENFILTAAHCINSRYGKVKQVKLGLHSLRKLEEETVQTFTVKNTYIYPDYSALKDYHDIALIELDRWADIQSGVKPACLHTSENLPVDEFVAAGWGATELHGSLNEILQGVYLKYVPYNSCAKYYRPQKRLDNGLVDDWQLCADGDGKRADTCQGDSGGPLLPRNNYNSLSTIIGITSFGIKCAIVPAVYTRVSYYLPWIENIVWPS